MDKSILHLENLFVRSNFFKKSLKTDLARLINFATLIFEFALLMLGEKRRPELRLLTLNGLK